RVSANSCWPSVAAALTARERSADRVMARIQLTHPRDGSRPVLLCTLSERNLLTLVTKLHTPGSRCAIGVGDVPEGFEMAWLQAEPDELHYASQTREGAPPGPMHPFSELVLLAVRRAIGEF